MAALALLPETLDAETQQCYPVVEYRTVCDILGRLPLNVSNGYHFVIDQYRSFLTSTLAPFELLRRFGLGQVSAEDFPTQFATATKELDLRDNDIRTFNYFYYFSFNQYLKPSDLIFGTADYNQGKNTQWQFEKNMQGQPFMEAIIEEPFSESGHWRMHEAFRAIFEGQRFAIAPRIEIWLDPKRLTAPTSYAGELLLGTWSPTLIQFLRDSEIYRPELAPVGKRNFHREELCVSDLPFEKLAGRIRSLLTKVFDHHPLEHDAGPR